MPFDHGNRDVAARVRHARGENCLPVVVAYNPAADPAGAFGEAAVQAVVSVINAITS